MNSKIFKKNFSCLSNFDIFILGKFIISIIFIGKFFFKEDFLFLILKLFDDLNCLCKFILGFSS